TQFLTRSVQAAIASTGALRFMTSAGATAADAAAFLRFQSLSAEAGSALSVFRNGKPLGFLGNAGRVMGKAFLPLTIVTGAMDAVTGGGYDGARGWATRGFGLAGAAGAATVLLASNPVGLAIGGAAVLAYGAWSLGNYVYDHWDDITDFAGKAADWAGDRISDAGHALGEARDWAGDRLSDAGEAIGDAAESVGSTIRNGLSALPLPSIF
ncbi:hypothetical protein G9H71_13520, partial [Motilibacter sp. E257]